MKKLLTLALTAALLLSSLSVAVLSTAAEEAAETSFRYGTASVELTLIEDFQSVEASPSFGLGSATCQDDMLRLETGDRFCDTYGIKGSMLSTETKFQSPENLVFSVKNNRSDGDIFFSVQPYSASAGNNLFTGWVDGVDVLLVDTNGKATAAARCPNMSLMSDRAGYIMPRGFEGYVVFPMACFVLHGQWGETYFTDLSKVDISALGFHVSMDDAMYVEFCIDDVFTCGALPAYEAPAAPETTTATPETDPVPAETTTPAESASATEPAESTGEPVESVSETASATEPGDATSGTEADSATEAVSATEAAGGGCGAAIGAAVILPVLAGVILLRKRED